jgi:triosephosphate isomerase (TIM)
MADSQRMPILTANWKMNMTRGEGEGFVRELLARPLPQGVEVVICPPFTLLQPLREALQGTSLRLGAQNMHYEEAGAYTGEISPLMLKDLGVEYVILGHSERRAIFHEDDALVGKKVAAALHHGLLPTLCVGESLTEREKGETLQVVERQLKAGLAAVPPEKAGQMVIAYEPVWAIGSGRAATGADALEVISFIRRFCRELFGETAARQMRLQYGGSVKGDNIRDFTDFPEIDGALVGGASLKADSWYSLLQAVGQQ